MEFEQLYKTFYKQVLSVVRKYDVDIEDYAQTFWLKVYKLNNTFVSAAHFMTYARTAIRNMYITEYRKKKEGPAYDDVDFQYQDIESSSLIEYVIADLEYKEKECVSEFINGEHITAIAKRHRLPRYKVERLIYNVQKRYIKEKNTRRSIFKVCGCHRDKSK